MARTATVIKFYTSITDFPTPWSTSQLFLDLDTNLLYRWNWTQYVTIWDWSGWIATDDYNNDFLLMWW